MLDHRYLLNSPALRRAGGPKILFMWLKSCPNRISFLEILCNAISTCIITLFWSPENKIPYDFGRRIYIWAKPMQSAPNSEVPSGQCGQYCFKKKIIKITLYTSQVIKTDKLLIIQLHISISVNCKDIVKLKDKSQPGQSSRLQLPVQCVLLFHGGCRLSRVVKNTFFLSWGWGWPPWRQRVEGSRA